MLSGSANTSSSPAAAGEAPQALFGSIAWFLRRFATATRLVEQMERTPGRRPDLRAALEQAGFKKWPRGAIEKAEAQLKQISRVRGGQLYRWLLDEGTDPETLAVPPSL